MESRAFSDPRATDVALTEKLLTTVAESGKDAKLPVMTTAELCALGGLAHPLIDAAAIAWWESQPDREAVARRAYDQLAQRGLIDAAAGTVSPQLGVILAGRARPAFIVVSRERPDGEPTVMQILGIADETAGLRAALLSIALPMVQTQPPSKYEWAGPIYNFFLTGAAKAGHDLAYWAAEHKNRTLDLYLPGSETNLPSERFVVTRTLRQLHVERSAKGTELERLTCDRDELGQVLLRSMTAACG